MLPNMWCRSNLPRKRMPGKRKVSDMALKWNEIIILRSVHSLGENIQSVDLSLCFPDNCYNNNNNNINNNNNNNNNREK